MTHTNALSADFRKYDQVEKAHTYRLAEHESDEFDEDYEIATLDLSHFLSGSERDRARFASNFVAALGEIGFAVLEGHGIDRALYDEVDEAVLELFEETPLADKLRFRAERHGSVAQGYFPIEHTSEIHDDLVEGWVFCRRAFDVPQRREGTFEPEDYWPRAGFEPRFRKVVEAHEQLTQERDELRSALAERQAKVTQVTPRPAQALAPAPFTLPRTPPRPTRPANPPLTVAPRVAAPPRRPLRR